MTMKLFGRKLEKRNVFISLASLTLVCVMIILRPLTDAYWMHISSTLRPDVASLDTSGARYRKTQYFGTPQEPNANQVLSNDVFPTLLANEITVVTAYLNLGTFNKGGPNLQYTPKKYMDWMKVFSRITNPVIAFVDTNETFQYFRSLRSEMDHNRTQVILVERKDLWAFQLKDKIQAIYSQPGYPRHEPNTVIPAYSCAMHAKFEFLARAIEKNYFRTNYFAWLDIGLFRDVGGDDNFGLDIPSDFDTTKIGYSEVFSMNPNVSYRDIVYNNMVWVGGAFILGKHDTMLAFTKQYRLFVNIFISENLMSTDQQILYGMYTTSAREKSKIQLQTYKSGWFQLGYLCKKSWEQNRDLSSEITLVTAYFNLSGFAKGVGNLTYTPEKYFEWMKVFGRILNPVVAYVDTNESYIYFKNLRQKFPEGKTKVILVDRKELQSFKFIDKIKAVFAQPDYPKYQPNPVMPEYSCAMHAKFEVLEQSITKNYFRTKYFAWIDIGLFRDENGTRNFGLSVPDNFDDNRIGYSEVNIHDPKATVRDVIYKSLTWVGGAFALGHHRVLRTFTKQYRRFVDYFLSHNLMSSDRQIIYGMYVEEIKEKATVHIQTFKSGWFRLGYLCKELWERQHVTTAAKLPSANITNSTLENKGGKSALTIVTAYFNIGQFAKGSQSHIYTPRKYFNWMKVFGRILNPVVAFVDTEESYKYFQELRKKFPQNMTKLILVKRENMWSFQLKDKIKAIYSQPGYPRHLPNTVSPEYSCAMHAKFEALEHAIDKNYFSTKYFAWLDIGLFRNAEGTSDFGLDIPPDFDDSKIGYSEVYARHSLPNLSLSTIVRSNMVWVGGAFNLGRYDVMMKFTKQYRKFVDIFLIQNLMSTDQQIIYGMYIDSMKDKVSVHLQTYKSGWFRLGYVCKRTWENNHNRHEVKRQN